MAVGTAGFQLVSQRGFVHDDVHEDCNHDGNDDPHVDLGVGEQVIQPHFGGFHPIERSLVNIARLGVFHHVFEVADVKHPRDQVGGQPVGHDTGKHFVDVQESLEQTGDGPPNSASQAAAHEGDDPNEASRDRLGGNPQGQHQGDHGTHEVLAGGADVEQTCLKGHSHREAGHNQGGGSEEHISDVCRVKTKGQVACGIPPCAEQTAKDQLDTVQCAGKGQVITGEAYNQDDDAAHHQANDNRENGGQDGLGRVLFQ